ncbi:MAG: Flp pilus assembly complex ATPase component TadA [Cellvibrionaceae bacterium]
MLSRCGLGKSRDNLVQLRGWKVAGIHAELEQRDDGLYIVDKVDAGTYVNNDRIEDEYGPLKESDVVGIGNYRISVRPLGAAEEYEANEQLRSEQDDDSDSDDSTKETSTAPKKTTAYQDQYILWQNHVHEELVKRMDLKRIDIGTMSDDALRDRIKALINEILDSLASGMPEAIDRNQLAEDVLNEAVGLGPLENLLADDSITEVMVNAFNDIYIERNGRLEPSDINYSSHVAVLSAIERIVSPLGRRIDESSPMVDARLKDGSRVNAIIPPLALKGPCITIRKFSKKKLEAEDLVGFGAVNDQMVKFLRIAVEQKKNIIISGGTGSGKTTLLNVLSNFIPHGERVITVEDAAELQLAQPHLVSLEARPPNMEGKGAIPIRDLVKNCLRMRPDRIVVGECRGGEALDMLQAMNTGHEGSLTTAHANTPRDMLSRIEVMVLMAGMDLPVQAIREQISSAVDIIVQQSRFPDGSRRITAINEVTGMETGVIQMQEIFLYKQEGYDENGRVKGQFKATGRVPEFYEDMRDRGLDADLSLFQ